MNVCVDSIHNRISSFQCIPSLSNSIWLSVFVYVHVKQSLLHFFAMWCLLLTGQDVTAFRMHQIQYSGQGLVINNCQTIKLEGHQTKLMFGTQYNGSTGSTKLCVTHCTFDSFLDPNSSRALHPFSISLLPQFPIESTQCLHNCSSVCTKTFQLPLLLLASNVYTVCHHNIIKGCWFHFLKCLYTTIKTKTMNRFRIRRS